jgi:ribose 5-phosphate isomerase B
MSSEDRLRDLVRRVARSALAEHGRARFPDGRMQLPPVPRVSGVHVEPHSAGERLRPAAGNTGKDATLAASRGAELVTRDCLASIPDGGCCAVERGAIITDLAREEAWRRRIVLCEPGTNPASRRGDGRLRVVLGADHGGFSLKQAAIEWVRELGHIALDLGTHDENPVDYPDYACAVAEAVSEGRADFGLLVDGAGIGSAMTANKVPGVRAALCHDVASARNAREHNHANVLTLSGRSTSARDAREILRAFVATPEGGERHAKRVQKIGLVESTYSRRKRASDGEVKP